MAGGIFMQKTYVKPNMANLHGKVGREILETIRNSTPPDLSDIRQKVEENKKKIQAERNIGIK